MNEGQGTLGDWFKAVPVSSKLENTREDRAERGSLKRGRAGRERHVPGASSAPRLRLRFIHCPGNTDFTRGA